MTHADPEQPTPTVPPTLRTVAYVVGIIAGFVLVPTFTAAGWTVAAVAAGGVAGAANALAFGYRPTRGT